MKKVCVGLLFMTSVGILPILGFYRSDECTQERMVIRCDNGLVLKVQKATRGRFLTPKVYCGQSILTRSRSPDITTCLLKHFQKQCNNKSLCYLDDRGEQNCSISERPRHFMTYKCVTKCGPNFTCNEITEICTDSDDGATCECAENYHKNESNVCIPDMYIRCSSGVINVTTSQGKTVRPIITDYRGEEVIPNHPAPCQSSDEFSSAKLRCDSRQECTFPEHKASDTCRSFVVFKCVTDSAPDSEVLQCANESIIIYCDNGVINTFQEPTRSEKTSNFKVKCGLQVIQNYSLPCLSKDQLSSINSECDNRSSCMIPNMVKGREESPCYAYPSYTCVSRCGVNDECNRTSEVCVDGEDGAICNCAENYKMSDGTCTEIIPTCDCDVQLKNGLTMTFRKTLNGQVAYSEEHCPLTSTFPSTALASRRCTGTWEKLRMNDCYEGNALDHQLQVLSQKKVTNDNVEEVAGILALISRQAEYITADGLDYLVVSLDSIVQLRNPSLKVTHSVVSVVSNVMVVEVDTLDDAQNVSYIVTALENQLAAVLKAGQNYSQVTKCVEVKAVQIGRPSLQNSFIFQSRSKGDTNDNDEVEEDNKTSLIVLPSSLLDRFNEGIETIPISFISYQDDSLFQSEDAKPLNGAGNTPVLDNIGSHVISATLEIDDVTVEGLPPESNVLINFSKPIIPPEIKDKNITITFVCVYWDTENGKWSEDGCSKSTNEIEDTVECSCDHLTSFAVLIRAHDNSTFHRVLSVTSQVGCMICIISLSFCVGTLILVRPVRKKQQTHIHLNLCLALIGFYFSFLLGIDKTQNEKLCKAMTSLIYFFCFASMAWMSVEAFYIYTLIWKYKRSGIRHFLPVSASFAWGVPAIGSGLVYILEDYVNDRDFCFLHRGYVFKFGFALEIGTLFLYNIIVFSLVTYRVSCRRIFFSNKHEKKTEIITRVKSTFLFWILLGMSWIFGFISILQKTPNYFCDAMFCLCMSLQGFCILYMLVLQNPEIMKLFRGNRKPLFSSFSMSSGMKNVYVVQKGSANGGTLRMQSNPRSSASEYC